MSIDNRTPENDPTAEARLTQVANQLNRELSNDQQDLVRKRIGQSMELAEKLRAAQLTNADEPEIVFQPYRRQGRGS